MATREGDECERGQQSELYPCSCSLNWLRVPADLDDVRDQFGDTALHMAARKGYAEIVDILLRQPLVEVDARNDVSAQAPQWLEQ